MTTTDVKVTGFINKLWPRCVLVLFHDFLYIKPKGFNPLTAGTEYNGFFTQLLPHSVPPFKHVKAIMKQQKTVDLYFIKSE